MALEVGSRLGHYVYDRFLAGEEVSIMPSRGSNAVPVAFNPNTGLVYTSSWNVPRIQKIAPMEFALGRRYTGVARRAPVFEPGDVLGHFVAINPLTGEKKWEVPLIDFPSSAGTLATGGGLVFTGKITGEFLALDEDTGKTLWQFKTGSSVNSTAITYTHNGQQYVSVASGLGGGRVNEYARGQVPTGGSMWTFALMPELLEIAPITRVEVLGSASDAAREALAGLGAVHFPSPGGFNR